MRVELSREFPVPLKAAYDYRSDWKLFTEWRVGMVEVLNPDTAAWTKPGDGFRFSYRMLGRVIEGESVIEEIREHEIDRFTSTVPGLGTVSETWIYKPIDEESFALTVIQEGHEPTSFFGQLIDRTLLSRVIQRDLERTLGHSRGHLLDGRTRLAVHPPSRPLPSSGGGPVVRLPFPPQRRARSCRERRSVEGETSG